MPWLTASCGEPMWAGLPFDKDLAAVDRVGAEDRAHQLGAARAHQAGDPQHLARVGGEADILQALALAQPLHPQHLSAPLGRLLRELLGEVTAYHQADQLVDVQLAGGQGGDVAAIAQHGDAVADLERFFQVVADVDDGDAVGAQLAHDGEEVVDLADAQGRGRLVHDDEAGLLVQRLGHLDHLLLADAELVHRRARIDVQVQLCQQPARLLVHLRPAQGDAVRDLAAQEDVLGDREVGHLVEFLVDRGDAGVLRLPGCGEVDRLALEDHLAAIARIDACQDLHQGGFAGAVLADQHVDLAPAHVEVHVGERQHAGEALGDPAHLQEERLVLVRRSRRKRCDHVRPDLECWSG